MDDTGGDDLSASAENTPDAITELDQLRSENEDLKAKMQSRANWRTVLVTLLVVLTSLSLVTSVIAVWAHERIFDTDKFMSLIGPGLEEPALDAMLSERVSAQVLDALDIETRVTVALTNLDAYLSEALLDAVDIDPDTRMLLDRFERPSLAALAPSIAESLEGRVEGRMDQFFTSDEFAALLPALVGRVHEAAIALVRDDLVELPNVYIEAGEVRLNLIPVITEALRPVAEDVRGILPDIQLPAAVSDVASEGREQLAAALQTRLPEDFGQLTIMTENDLADVQGLAARFDRYVWGLVLLTLLLAASTIVVSPNRRRTTLHLGLGVLVGITIAAVAMRRIQEGVLDQVTSPAGEQSALALLNGVLTDLRIVQLIVAIVAVVIAIVAFIAGRPPWLDSLSGRVRHSAVGNEEGSDAYSWIAENYNPLRVVGAGLALLVFFLIGFEIWAVILISVVLGGYLWAISQARNRAVSPVAETSMAIDGKEPG